MIYDPSPSSFTEWQDIIYDEGMCELGEGGETSSGRYDRSNQIKSLSFGVAGYG